MESKVLHKQIDLIKYPIITEKSTRLFENNQYTFIVDKKSRKSDIKKAIEYLFQVDVVKVNICVLPKKKKRLNKYVGYRPLYKKAIIKLAKDNNIDLFTNV